MPLNQIAFLLPLLLCTKAGAVVIVNDMIRSVTGGFPRPTNTISYDLNNDGQIDLSFTASASTFLFTADGPDSTLFLRDNTMPEQTGPFLVLASGNVIGESSEGEFSNGGGLLSFVFEDGGTITGGPFLNQEAYLGFSFEADDGTHFGYAFIREFGGTGGAILQTAYETEPDKAILAGAVPEPSSFALLILGCSALFRRKR